MLLRFCPLNDRAVLDLQGNDAVPGKPQLLIRFCRLEKKIINEFVFVYGNQRVGRNGIKRLWLFSVHHDAAIFLRALENELH